MIEINYKTFIYGILILLCISILILFFIILYISLKSNIESKSSSGTSPSGTSPIINGVGTLFITAENNYETNMDIPKFPNGRFYSVCMIWLNSSSIHMIDFYNQIKDLVHKNNPTFNSFEYWIQLDVDTGDSWETATCKGTACVDIIKNEVITANKLLNPSKITGLYFDNESTHDLENLVISLKNVANMFTPSLKLGFTKGIKDCTSTKIYETDFDYCFGQTYTNQTADIYINNCGSIDMDEAMNNTINKYAWGGLPIIISGGYSIPLFCGGGNCQTDMNWHDDDDAKSKSYCCVDERLNNDSSKIVMDYMNSTDMRNKFPNFGFWFGNGSGLCTFCNKTSSCTPCKSIKTCTQ